MGREAWGAGCCGDENLETKMRNLVGPRGQSDPILPLLWSGPLETRPPCKWAGITKVKIHLGHWLLSIKPLSQNEGCPHALLPNCKQHHRHCFLRRRPSLVLTEREPRFFPAYLRFLRAHCRPQSLLTSVPSHPHSCSRTGFARPHRLQRHLPPLPFTPHPQRPISRKRASFGKQQP